VKAPYRVAFVVFAVFCVDGCGGLPDAEIEKLYADTPPKFCPIAEGDCGNGWGPVYTVTTQADAGTDATDGAP
jgi:hypothetical protein